MKSKTLVIIVVSLIVGVIIGNANFYKGGGNYGVSWNRGGIEATLAVEESASVGVYLCDASYSRKTGVSTHFTYTGLLNELVVEC